MDKSFRLQASILVIAICVSGAQVVFAAASSSVSNVKKCSAEALYKTYMVKKAGGVNMNNFSQLSWWSSCPLSNRKAAYTKISSPPPKVSNTSARAVNSMVRSTSSSVSSVAPIEQNFDKTNCLRFGPAIYNAMSEKCECKYGYVPIGNLCVNPPYCGANGYYDSGTRQCECSTGYKKQGGQCIAVNCTPMSTYNSSTGLCECWTGYVVKDNKCVDPSRVCGYAGTYNVATETCSCSSGYYLKNGSCTLEPYCGLGGTFNSILGSCVCQAGYSKVGSYCSMDFSLPRTNYNSDYDVERRMNCPNGQHASKTPEGLNTCVSY